MDGLADILSASIAGMGLGGNQQTSNAELRRHHDRALAQQADMLRKANVFVANTSGAAKPPTRRDTAAAMASYTPILVSDLHVGTTHKGRLLRGTIPVRECKTCCRPSMHGIIRLRLWIDSSLPFRQQVMPLMMKGVMTLLEDERGDLVRVSCVPPPPTRYRRDSGSIPTIKTHRNNLPGHIRRQSKIVSC